MTECTLIVNTAEHRVQFGLVQGDTLLCWQDWLAASQGAELLSPALAEAMQRVGVLSSAISRIACVCGPGAFTGLRLALSTASALHHALGIPLASINYLHALAQGVPCGVGQRVRVCTHARRNLVYWQDFTLSEGSEVAGHLTPLTAPVVSSVLQAQEGLEVAVSGLYPVFVVGSGVTKYWDAFSLYDSATVRCVPHLFDQPTGASLLLLATIADYSMNELVPLYLRGSEAEDNLEMLAVRRGDDPETARNSLEALLKQRPASIV